MGSTLWLAGQEVGLGAHGARLRGGAHLLLEDGLLLLGKLLLGKLLLLLEQSLMQ